MIYDVIFTESVDTSVGGTSRCLVKPMSHLILSQLHTESGQGLNGKWVMLDLETVQSK